jgi:hypothetical protein
MRHRLATGFGLVLLLALAPAALAQRTTGAIFGTVTDESGAILPGVTVTLQGAGVPGTPSTVTSGSGIYRFPNLPPGNYTLTFELQGFTKLTREQVPVAVGQEVDLNIQLKVSTLSETVTVTGESPVVNVASTLVSTNFNREWVSNAPQRRFTFFDLINQGAGVSASTSTSSRSTSFGSSGNENSYQLDGTDFTAPFTGAAWPWPNTDAIEEIEILSLGATAEYGNVQGAVFNVVTRQGSNQFHGDGNYYHQSQGLTGRNTTDAQDGGQPYHRARFRDTTWQLGGPVVKDKFWFFGSFQFQQDYESQPGTPAAFPARSQAKRVFFKLNDQLTKNQKIQFAYHDDFYRIPGRATALTAPSTIGVENGHNPSPNLTYTAVLSNSTVVEARYSGFYGKDHGDPLESGEPRVKPRFYDLNTGQITGGIYSWYDGDSWKTGFNGKVSHFADNFIGGSHDFKLGVQYGSGGSDYITGINDYIYTYGTTPAYGYTQLPYHQGGVMKTIGVFADDTYRLGSRVVLNLGVRYDHSRATFESKPFLDKNGNPTGTSAPGNDNLFTWDKVSPRFGITYKVNNSGKTVVKGHYGRYYRGIITGEYDNASPSKSARYLFDGVYDAAGNPIGKVKVSDNSNLRISSEFDSPYTDQFIAGFEQEIVPQVGLQVNYVHKRSDRFGAFLDVAGTYVPVPFTDNIGATPSGQTLTLYRLVSDADGRIYELSTDSRMFSRYNGVSFQVNKRMAHHWQGTFSLVLSKSTGRIGSSLGSPTFTQSSSANGSNSGGGLPGFGANPNDFVNTDGRLIGDRPVIAKAQIVYNLPGGFMIGANMQHQTGRLWSRQLRVRGLGFPVRPSINMEANTGDRRVADWNLIDMRIEKSFKLDQRNTNVAVFGDILNLTNSSANESIGSRDAESTSFGLATRFIQPRRLMIGAKIRF